MWFGDLVTMRWWDDLWLNESFATFVSVLCQSQATRWTSAWTTFANIEKTWAYRQDQLSSTHPIAADIPDVQAVEVNFDGITYAKGASVLKQLAAYVGIEEFLRAMRVYFRRHEYGNTTLADLLRVLAEESGRDLSRWSAQWLQTAGINTLRAEFTLDGQGRYASFAIVQGPAGPDPRSARARSATARARATGRLAPRPATCRPSGHCPAGSPAGRRAVQRGRVQGGPVRPGGARRARRADRGAGAGRRPAAGPAAGQRRRPDVREGPAGLPVAGHGGRAGRGHRRPAAPGAVLGRGLGHDPGRRDGRPGLRGAGAGRRQLGVRDRRGAVHPGQGAQRPGPLRRPGLGGRGLEPVRRARGGCAAGGRAGLGPPARLGAHVGRVGPVRRARRAAARAAVRRGGRAGAGGGRRAALDAAARAGGARRGRRRGDRRRAGARSDRVRPAARRDRPGAAADAGRPRPRRGGRRPRTTSCRTRSTRRSSPGSTTARTRS